MSKNRIRAKVGHYERLKWMTHHEKIERAALVSPSIRAEIKFRAMVRKKRGRLGLWLARMAWKFTDRRSYREVPWKKVA